MFQIDVPNREFEGHRGVDVGGLYARGRRGEAGIVHVAD